MSVEDPDAEGLDTGDDSERRISAIERRAFEQAVTKATEKATEEVAKVNRRKSLILTAVVTGFISAAVSVAVILFVVNSNRSTQKNNSTYNCTLLTQISGIMSQFVSSEAFLHKQQQLDQKQIAKLHPGALRQLFKDPETVRLSKRSAELDAQTSDLWQNVLAPGLSHLANLNCNSQIH